MRQAVQAKLKEIGSDDPKKLNLAENPPRLKSGVPIFTVRVRRPPGVFAIGNAKHPRHVISDANHHAEILEVKDKKGRLKWEGHVVPLHEAYRRLRAKEPVVKKDHGPDKRFLFTLTSGDIIELDGHDGQRVLFRIRSVWPTGSGGRISYVGLSDARIEGKIKEAKQFFTAMVEPLRKMNCRKVTITPLGEARYAND